MPDTVSTQSFVGITHTPCEHRSSFCLVFISCSLLFVNCVFNWSKNKLRPRVMEKACSHKLSSKVGGGGDGATLQKWHKIKCSRASQMEFGLIYGRQTARWPQQRWQHDLANIKHDVALYWPNRYAIREGERERGSRVTIRQSNPSKRPHCGGFISHLLKANAFMQKCPLADLLCVGFSAYSFRLPPSLPCSLTFALCVCFENKIK